MIYNEVIAFRISLLDFFLENLIDWFKNLSDWFAIKLSHLECTEKSLKMYKAN